MVAPTLKIFTFLPVASIPAATNRPLALTATACGELASGYDLVRVGVAETAYSVTANGELPVAMNARLPAGASAASYWLPPVPGVAPRLVGGWVVMSSNSPMVLTVVEGEEVSTGGANSSVPSQKVSLVGSRVTIRCPPGVVSEKISSPPP